MEHNSLLLKWDFHPKSTVAKPGICYLNQVVKVNINSDMI